MFFRVIASVILASLWLTWRLIASPVGTLVAGESAAHQFDNSDTSYVTSIVGIKAGNGGINALVTLCVLVLLLLIWYGPLYRFFKAKAGSFMIGLFLLAGLYVPSARAYYATTDYTEVYVVLPSHSAFLIPDVGDNRDTQQGMNSEAYLNSKKVAVKRVQIPHTKLEGSGYLANYVVPAARLIIVDRTPYYSEWAMDPSKGTSNANQGFSCESAESINVSFDILASADVEEDNAAKFLYWFGVDPLGSDPAHPIKDKDGKLITVADQSDPNIQFASVIYGKSLKEVMDQQVRGYIHAAICNEMGVLPLMTIFGSKAKIIKAVEQATKDFFKDRGLTINFIGFASPLNYDSKVQAAINSVFEAGKTAEARLELQTTLDYQRQLADISVRESEGTAISKWDGRLPAITFPNIMWMPQAAWDWITGWFTGKKTGS